MRLLLTNDDGINAPGLKSLEKIAWDLVGAKGEVWVVAPAFEQSGVAHCISYTKPMMISKMGKHRYAAEGSPADCILAGIHHILPEKPDLVLSGVNRGNNSGENALYSGTLGGALEAALQGLPAVALSQYLGPDNYQIENPFEASEQFGADILRKIIAAGDDAANGYGLFYNVNFPPVPAKAVKGTKLAAQGRREGVHFGTEPLRSPSGREYIWIKGGDQRAPAAAGSDVAINLDGYISVTPMRADLTAHDRLGSIEF